MKKLEIGCAARHRDADIGTQSFEVADIIPQWYDKSVMVKDTEGNAYDAQDLIVTATPEELKEHKEYLRKLELARGPVTNCVREMADIMNQYGLSNNPHIGSSVDTAFDEQELKEIEEVVNDFFEGTDLNLVKWKIATPDSPEGFVKHDDGKPMVSLVEPSFVLAMASVLTSGARKYTPDNWKRCKEPQRYKDAALRHFYAYLGGEKNDPETGQSHLIHVACNLMFLFWLDTNEKA